jgi:hypothetical protein
MSIKQLSATYDSKEDRVMFRLTTKDENEFRLWLTRSIVRNILALAKHASVTELEKTHPLAHARDISEFNQQLKNSNATFTDFEPAPNHPLGETPVLVEKAEIKFSPPNAYVLELQLSKAKILKLPLNDELNSQLRLVLEKIAEHAEWNIQPIDINESKSGQAPSVAQSSSSDQQKLLH